MRRREFIVSSLVLASWPEIAAAQSPAKPVRIGWIVQNTASVSAPYLEALRAGLADLGYAEGRNLTIETRYGDDVPERVPVLIDELLRIPVDVIVTQGPTTWAVVKSVTRVPVVYVFSGDPGEPEAIVVFPDPVTNRNRQRIIDFAGTRHIPVISGWAIYARSGALCTYGPRLTESYKRAARQPQDRQGARPHRAADDPRPRRRGYRMSGR